MEDQYAALSMGDPTYGGGFEVWKANQGNFNLTNSSTWGGNTGGGGGFQSAYNQSAQTNYGSGSSGMLQQGSAMFASGMTDLISSSIGGKKRRSEQAQANKEFQQTKNAYAMHDTSNPYANLENPYEDLTVNQQQAEFVAQKQQQGLANTLGALKGAAGGSGIASLAQAMANQQSVNLQKSSASIGLQESRNQQLAAGGAMAVQSMERKGEAMSQQMELEKISTMFGMAQQRKAAADEAREKALRGVISGSMESIVGGGLIVGGVMGQMGGSDRRLKTDIEFLKYSPSGLKIYAFEYINKIFGKGVFQGVMSDEIPQNAVIKHENGYDMVDYSKIDVEFKQIKS